MPTLFVSLITSNVSSSNKYAIASTKECVDNCPDEYPYKMNKLCYRKCEATYILTDEANKECLDELGIQVIRLF